MSFVIDQEFRDHFRNLKQVFMYITDECNLRCEQCIYKPSITFNIQREIPLETAVGLLSSFRELGASKVTFLGGEPTLYGIRQLHKPLFEVIREARRMGYEYIRLDSNGQFSGTLLGNSDFQSLDEIAFSLDGYSSATNDLLRGKNTFERCVANIKLAVALGYAATITCCVHRELVRRDGAGSYGVETMIRFAESLGLSGINFHDLFKAGVPMDTWTGDFNPSLEEWVAVYNELRPRIDEGFYRIPVRLPQCFITREEFDQDPEYYGYCPVKLGERVMVHNHGVIRICSNLICTAYGVARYSEDRIMWEKSSANEIRGHNLYQLTPCTNRSRHRTYGRYVPLCFSFKPQQDEFVWQQKLKWEERRKSALLCYEG